MWGAICISERVGVVHTSSKIHLRKLETLAIVFLEAREIVSPYVYQHGITRRSFAQRPLHRPYSSC